MAIAFIGTLSASILSASAPMATARQVVAPCPLRADFVKEPVGRTENALRKAYGRPAGGQDFLLANGLNPYRRSLRTLYPSAKFDRLPIRELGWLKGDCRLIVWFVRRAGTWTAVQALRSNTAGEF